MLLTLIAAAWAVCPAEVTLQGELTCSSDITGLIAHTDPSYLGGECEDSSCYTCGEPYANEDQVAPEAVYSFTCQRSGSVLMRITDLPCDLDIYVLDDTCDPYAGCLYGSTASYAEDDQVEFTCTEGATYYIVVEAYGTEHLDVASGPCTDDGTSTGSVFDPTYTLSFDVSQSTGCAEDCDDGLDDDLDDLTDCEDDDCFREPLCCDLDGDGSFALDCEGDDCDDADATVHPGAPELADVLDNDCDGATDEGTDAYDDDGDGLSEQEGDCDDADAGINPNETDIPGNGIDEDCDDADAQEETPIEDTGGDDSGASGGGDDTGEGTGEVIDGGGSKDNQGCSCSASSGRAAGGLLLLPLAVLWRRRR